jgi:hypothetical protein
VTLFAGLNLNHLAGSRLSAFLPASKVYYLALGIKQPVQVRFPAHERFSFIGNIGPAVVVLVLHAADAMRKKLRAMFLAHAKLREARLARAPQVGSREGLRLSVLHKPIGVVVDRSRDGMRCERRRPPFVKRQPSTLSMCGTASSVCRTRSVSGRSGKGMSGDPS